MNTELIKRKSDGNEPLTKEWLVAVGLRYLSDDYWILSSQCIRLRVRVRPIGEWYIGHERIPEHLWPKTRDQFRQLCQTLGVKLTDCA